MQNTGVTLATRGTTSEIDTGGMVTGSALGVYTQQKDQLWLGKGHGLARLTTHLVCVEQTGQHAYLHGTTGARSQPRVGWLRALVQCSSIAWQSVANCAARLKSWEAGWIAAQGTITLLTPFLQFAWRQLRNCETLPPHGEAGLIRLCSILYVSLHIHYYLWSLFETVDE